MKKKSIIAVVIATGFGTGYWPWGPGTAGALAATGLWLLLFHFLPLSSLFCITLFLIVLFAIVGVWATGKLQMFWGDDPSRVVVDEIVGVWVPLLLATCWQEALVALVLFRFFDIVKPFGIRSLDERKGAVWVMADDILAGVYSAVILGIIKLII